jgi:predicted O-methyltransferase YrrM
MRDAIREELRRQKRSTIEEVDARVARELVSEPGYSFTRDFLTHVVVNWGILRDEYRDQPGVRMLEIGSFEGRSAVWFLENVLTHPTSSLVCVDTFEAGDARFDHNIRVSGSAEKVTKLKGPSETVVWPLPRESFDLAYVDGDHHAGAVLMDGMLSWQRLKPGGVMIFDDYWMDKIPGNRPQMAIDVFLEMFEQQYRALLKGNQVILRKLA